MSPVGIGSSAEERKREEMIILAKRHEVHQQRIHAAGETPEEPEMGIASRGVETKDFSFFFQLRQSNNRTIFFQFPFYLYLISIFE